MSINFALQEINVERCHRIAVLNKIDQKALSMWGEALQSVPSDDREALNNAYNFATKIEYQHVGLSSDAYFSHPLRVATMSLFLANKSEIENGIVAILHNVLEVSTISIDELTEHFGQTIATQIQNLTVDRERQWEVDYKRSYYKTLSAGRRSARLVKILDKLDNLYLLCLNPDADIRMRYLKEIKKYLLPMVDNDLPHLSKYFRELVSDCESLGFLPEVQLEQYLKENQ